MNWKMVIISNWKVALLLLQLSVFAIMLVAGVPLGDPIDNPWGPG